MKIGILHIQKAVATLILCSMSYISNAQFGAGSSNNTPSQSNTTPTLVDPNNPYNNNTQSSSNTDPNAGGGSISNSGPGGPTDPPPDNLPFDGGVSILLTIAVAQGYKASRKKKALMTEHEIK
jgi:hypothetical protein